MEPVIKVIEDTASFVCDNLCKYRDTCDEKCVCDYMREHDGQCPLDRLCQGEKMTHEEETAWNTAVSLKSDSPVESEPYLIIARGKGHYYFYRGTDGAIYYESDIDKDFNAKKKPRSAKAKASK